MEKPLSVVDLHCHSTASDGRLTPTALVEAAAAAGVELLALTDHDTVAGIAEAQAAASHCGLRLLPGIELSSTWQKRTLHIVGLGIDPQAPALVAGLSGLQQLRAERATAIAAKIEKLGVKDALQRAAAIAGDGQITRTHFARLLIESGVCKDMKKAFKRYLSSGKPQYVAVQWPAPEDIIAWIHAAGGRAVLAHPLRYDMSAAWRQRMLTAFREAGGDAIEVCCGNSETSDVNTSAAEAVQHGLQGSVGSDFHDPEQRWARLGRIPPLPNNVTPVWAGL